MTEHLTDAALAAAIIEAALDWEGCSTARDPHADTRGDAEGTLRELVLELHARRLAEQERGR